MVPRRSPLQPALKCFGRINLWNGASGGEIQVPDVPGRKEPGTGEINYAGIPNALKKMGYGGTVCMEPFGSGDVETALEAFRTAFTV